MRLLGIDFGLSKIGLAISEGNLVQPLIVIRHSVGFLSKIVEICKKEQVEKIIVGFPEGKLGEQTEKFARKLSQATGLPVAFQDETLTTHQATAKMIAGRKKRKIRQKFKDAFAAACILQEYLGERRENV